jgi:hypothetical protein
VTSAHAEPFDLSAAAADVGPGHPVTVHPAGRPALRLVTPVDWAVGELARAFVMHAPPEVLDPGAGLATGREAGDVYAMVFQDGGGCPFGESTQRAVALVRAIDRVLEELYDALGPDAELVPVVPRLRADLLERARAEAAEVVREAGGPPDWVDATMHQTDWLRAHPAGRR